jgi:hypothetical protein
MYLGLFYPALTRKPPTDFAPPTARAAPPVPPAQRARPLGRRVPTRAVPPRFLPEFDNLLLAYADRTRVIANAYRPRVFGSVGRSTPRFLIDGFVAGAWKLDVHRHRATLSVQPFFMLPAADREALAEEGERLLLFMAPTAKEHAVSLADAA